ncbi:MAG: nitroreductase family protein [Bacteroidales bacterium]|nr:nitroreductase family protein [Bacteroidales bacterium]
MDAIKTILGRRSIRKYTNRPVPQEVVKTMLNAAMHAPTARNIQPWHFVVVDDRATLDQLAEAHPYAKMLKEATLAILVCGDKKLQEMDGYIVQDCSAATQNILLAAHANGLGGVWLGMYPREKRMEDVGRLLNIPEHILPVSLISIGYPDETKETPERYKTDRVHYNGF